MRIRFFTALVLALCVGNSHAALLGDDVDLRVVVDVSRHVSIDAAGKIDAGNDMAKLRGRVIERLTRSLRTGTRAGIWTYAQHVNLLVGHEPVTDLWKQITAIHARNLAAAGDTADLGKALQAATWDLGEVSSARRHVVLVTSGEYSRRKTDAMPLRQELINGWVKKLAQSDITVHVVVIGEQLPELLRQIADVRGGLRASVTDEKSADAATLDLIDLIALQGQAVVDDVGRFQVEPGATELIALWLSTSDDARLVQPNGVSLDGMTPIAAGRWLVGSDFEIVSIRNPQVGWWQVQGGRPERIGIYADLRVRVDGVSSTVVPTQESAATISLSNRGQPITDAEFLDLLDVRAWVNASGVRLPLPVERDQFAFTAYFVNMEDGPQKLEVSVTGPTFQRDVVMPFVVYNPLRVEAVGTAGHHAAWVQFSHPEVDYASVKVTARARKAPQPAHIIPGVREPAGLWKVPIEWSDGIVEFTFSISGNYLNKKGFFMKTKPVNMSLPVAENERLVFLFDAEGGHIMQNSSRDRAATDAMGATVLDPVASRGAHSPPPPDIGAPRPEAALTAAPARGVIPIWFAGLIACLNLGIAAVIWWLFRPKPLPAYLQTAPG